MVEMRDRDKCRGLLEEAEEREVKRGRQGEETAGGGGARSAECRS